METQMLPSSDWDETLRNNGTLMPTDRQTDTTVYFTPALIKTNWIQG